VPAFTVECEGVGLVSQFSMIDVYRHHQGSPQQTRLIPTVVHHIIRSFLYYKFAKQKKSGAEAHPSLQHPVVIKVNIV
jgi:hypothetical protein